MVPPGGRRRGAEFGVLGPELLTDPLAFLSAEHLRQGALLAHLERLARHPQARGARALAAALMEWLAVELPRHMADEERSLHARLEPYDTEGLLLRLREDHVDEREAAKALIADLRAIAAHHSPGPGFAALARRFASGFRAHLATEEAEVTPLARRVLSAEILTQIAAELAARRA
ncbi:hemerythrin domain-containing protein [Neoroseomonas soli]|uniref:Hemerythrin domain-containing protein n=1 Tax=Neoroseomonas soli TaxID=1081025 RepID=A0A9X9X028_9PROT|nr:hemerythrin domain-containing protein [Neoroseomonas soli]MBR0672757.1 hemerythrin domain-containing protein [Neoroseomonas soli]